MNRISPKPMLWHEAYERLSEYARLHPCAPPLPPKPLILAGWDYSNDVEKMQRWQETVDWAEKNKCTYLISEFSDSDFYFVDLPTNYEVGPLAGPAYRPWDFEEKSPLSTVKNAQLMDILISCWPEVVGAELASITRPLRFCGKKARRLLVLADASAAPSWGSWSHLSSQESERRAFTHFRSAINKMIAPHEVDHVDFTTEADAE